MYVNPTQLLSLIRVAHGDLKTLVKANTVADKSDQLGEEELLAQLSYVSPKIDTISLPLNFTHKGRWFLRQRTQRRTRSRILYIY